MPRVVIKKCVRSMHNFEGKLSLRVLVILLWFAEEVHHKLYLFACLAKFLLVILKVRNIFRLLIQLTMIVIFFDLHGRS